MPVRSFDDPQSGLLQMAGAEKSCKVRVNNGATGQIPYSQLLDIRSTGAPADSTAEFLKGLPSYNENNFARFQPDTSFKNAMKKPTVYYPTKEHPCEQIITTEKTTILLRYLHQQYEKKKAQLKRDTENAGPSGSSEPVPRKKFRLQNNLNEQ